MRLFCFPPTGSNSERRTGGFERAHRIDDAYDTNPKVHGHSPSAMHGYVAQDDTVLHSNFSTVTLVLSKQALPM
jgi:hypothetical protein